MHPHRVEDVLSLARERIKGEYKFINIGWENYSGEVKLERKGVYSVKGSFEIDGDTVTIRELPIGKNIRDYKTFLE